jgi:adenosylcobyric acid synthase
VDSPLVNVDGERFVNKLAPVIMVQGTASHAGKSTIAAALCRILARQGRRVAPFKAQNMALNSFVAANGGEVGRAQALQARAAGVDPTTDMNPILLKPEGDSRSQVIVDGRSIGSMTAIEYHHRKLELWPRVVGALDRLRTEYEIIVAEGAGSPAEINLRHSDLANMRVALHSGAAVLLVGDIDRGGVFAALHGTVDLLDPAERALLAGLCINKFRGDPAILAPGLEEIARRSGVPVLGVLPHVALDLPEEDSLGLPPGSAADDTLPDVAIIRLPHIANFDEFGPLFAEPSIRARYVDECRELGTPGLVIIPGTKTTLADLDWLRSTGLAAAIGQLASRGCAVLGICGGYQMLGHSIADPTGVEGPAGEARGMGLLPMVTTLERQKTTRRIMVRLSGNPTFMRGAGDVEVGAYEIHVGESRELVDNVRAFGRIDGLPRAAIGLVDSGGQIAGTYLHGLFESPVVREALIAHLLRGRGKSPRFASRADPLDQRIDRWADIVAAHLDIGRLASKAVHARLDA